MGTLTVADLAPFPFPAGVTTTMDTGTASGAECAHDVVLPPGGFVVPHFDVPELGYCSALIPLHCESGVGEGHGALWDGNGTPDAALTDVTKHGDTSDGTCDTTFDGTNCTTAPGGSGANTLGDVDETVSATGGGGVRTLVDIRAESLTWSDSACLPATNPGCCAVADYGDDTVDNGEMLITRYDFVLTPTTGTATAAFVDVNSDGCARAGRGFDAAGPDGPVSLTGTPASGPCCSEGQATDLVMAGIGFGGGAPLFDVGFRSTMPNTVAVCDVAGAPSTCTVTTDACLW